MILQILQRVEASNLLEIQRKRVLAAPALLQEHLALLENVLQRLDRHRLDPHVAHLHAKDYQLQDAAVHELRHLLRLAVRGGVRDRPDGFALHIDFVVLRDLDQLLNNIALKHVIQHIRAARCEVRNRPRRLPSHRAFVVAQQHVQRGQRASVYHLDRKRVLARH